MRAHETGPRALSDLSPTWLPFPRDVNALLPDLWSETTRRDESGAIAVAGITVSEIAARAGTPTLVVDEQDFRARARGFREAFQAAFAGEGMNGIDVFYAGKAFLCVAVARWMAEEGLFLDVCSAGELACAERAGFPPERIGLHGNNKSEAELRHAVRIGVGRIVVDSMTEIERLEAIAAELGVRATVYVRVTTGVEAHTHEFIATAHEDQKFGLSLATGAAARATSAVLAAPHLDLAGIHSHIGSQIFDTGGFEVAARRLVDLIAQVRDRHDTVIEGLDLGGGFGAMYTSQNTPQTPQRLAGRMAAIVRDACAARDLPVPRVSIEPGRAIAGPSTQTVYTVGTVKDVVVDGDLHRQYVAVDGGMSDNIRTALYDADYSAMLASRVSDAAPVVSRVVGKHCESGDVIVRDEYLPADIRPGDLVSVPVTGAYCYSMASNYNHVPRPAVVAVRDGALRTLIRRETDEDLLRLDQG